MSFRCRSISTIIIFEQDDIGSIVPTSRFLWGRRLQTGILPSFVLPNFDLPRSVRVTLWPSNIVAWLTTLPLTACASGTWAPSYHERKAVTACFCKFILGHRLVFTPYVLIFACRVLIAACDDTSGCSKFNPNHDLIRAMKCKRNGYSSPCSWGLRNRMIEDK